MTSLYDTAISDVGWANRSLGILRIEGLDAVKWLHKIVTADVEHLKTGQGTRSALLDSRGHFAADFMLLRDGDALGALVDPAGLDSLYQTLQRYIFREKVTISNVTERWMHLTLIGPHAGAVVERVLETRAPEHLYDWSWGRVNITAARVVRAAHGRVPAFDILIPLSGAGDLRAAIQDLPELSDEVLEILRIEAGLPRWRVDLDEATLALEVPDVMQIRVDQGCYVGQEVVARIVHRGHVNRYLRGLRIETEALPLRGETIRFEGVDVGMVTSAARSPMFGTIALGFVRRHVEVGSQVHIDRTTARVIELPFPVV